MSECIIFDSSHVANSLSGHNILSYFPHHFFVSSVSVRKTNVILILLNVLCTIFPFFQGFRILFLSVMFLNFTIMCQSFSFSVFILFGAPWELWIGFFLSLIFRSYLLTISLSMLFLKPILSFWDSCCTDIDSSSSNSNFLYVYIF